MSSIDNKALVGLGMTNLPTWRWQNASTYLTMLCACFYWLPYVSVSASNVTLEFGEPVDLGSGVYSAWSLTSIYNPPKTKYDLIISVGRQVMRSGDGKSWGVVPGVNKTFGLLTAYPPPRAPAANFPLHDFGDTEARQARQKMRGGC